MAGIARFCKNRAFDGLKLVHGNVLAPVGAGNKIICQLVNDQARTWGGGVARAAAQKYPVAQRQFSEWIISVPKRERLGKTHFAKADAGLFVASLVAQQGYGGSLIPRIRYAALEHSLVSVATFAEQNEANIHMPRIGAGQSGGSWDMVEEIVRETLVARGMSVTVYDLPPKRQQEQAELLI